MSLMARVRRVALAWVLLLVAGAAVAEDARMTLYVFKQGLPQPDIEVLVDDRLYGLTDANGVVRITFEPGIRFLELRDQDLVLLSQQLLMHEAEDSQWIVNVTQGLGALVDAESSAGDLVPAVASEDPTATGAPGVLEGRLVSAGDGGPVAGARIFVSGLGSDIRSDAEGRFRVELPAGAYSVSVLHAAHNTLTRDGIEVAAEATVDLTLDLTPSGSELPEFVVIEPYIEGSLASVLEERRDELAVANILGAEQISKAGDSNAASALRRVTGLTQGVDLTPAARAGRLEQGLAQAQRVVDRRRRYGRGPRFPAQGHDAGHLRRGPRRARRRRRREPPPGSRPSPP